MPRLNTLFASLGALLLSGLFAAGDEQVRIQATVAKKTVVRPASRGALGEESGRVQTLVLSVQNRSIRALPEGSVAWTAVVRRHSSGSHKYSGVGKLAPMLSFKAAELQFGAFEVEARQTGVAVERDKIDYEVVISYNGKESFRTTSISNFAVLAANAQEMGNQEDGPGGNNENAAIPAPAIPAQPPPADEGKMPPKASAAPVAEVAKPAVEPLRVAPPVPQQPFDFFNLNGKKRPEPE